MGGRHTAFTRPRQFVAPPTAVQAALLSTGPQETPRSLQGTSGRQPGTPPRQDSFFTLRSIPLPIPSIFTTFSRSVHCPSPTLPLPRSMTEPCDWRATPSFPPASPLPVQPCTG